MRKLTLKKESVAELTTGELAGVVGGATEKYCLSNLLTCECSHVDDCLTWHCETLNRGC